MEESPSKKRRKAKFKEISTNLSKEELIRRLKTAAQELTNVDQGESTTEFDQFAASLTTHYIFYNQDKDVKSYAACCLADILRIYAPVPPYNEEQLKDIFRLLLQQLKGLENVQGPSYKRHFYILESLALVKTFNVCMELDAQDIILDLFKLFFSIVSVQHNIRVKNFMLDVMCPLIQEGDSLSQEILDVILINMVEPRKTKCKEAYKLACDLLERCSSSIEPYIQLFFNNTIVLGGNVESELGQHLYDLLFELYKVNKSVLLSVLPQLEFKLKGNEESERLEAVQLLGRMFADDDSSLAESNKALWNCYLGRFLDIAVDVRVECVQMAKQFLLSSSSSLRSDVTDQLINRLLDPDEKVRLETVMTVCEAAAEKFELIHVKLMDGVKERMRDKKWLIRREAITCIGKLYKRINASSSNPHDIKNISWAPLKVLHLYFQDSIEDRLCIERVLHGCLIPVSLDIEERMKRLFKVYTSLDDAASNVFDGMLKHRARVNRDFRALLEAFQSEESEDKNKIIYTRTVSLARNLPDPYKAQEHLKRLMLLCSDKKFCDLLVTCSDVNEECPKIIKAVTEIIKRVTSKNPIVETVKALLDRACPMLIDMPSFVALLKVIKKHLDGIGDDEDIDSSDDDVLVKGKCGLKLIKTLASSRPSIFQSKQCFEVLLLFIKHKDPNIVETTLRALHHVISELEEVDKTFCSCYQPVLSKLATQGTCKQAKYALCCLNRMLKDSTLVMQRIFKNLLENLNFDTSGYRLRMTLAALQELAVLVPSIFETKHKIIVRDFIVKEILVVDREKSTNSQEVENEWCSDYDVSEETLLKIEGIKLLTHWLLGLQDRHSENAIPVFRLLNTLLNHDGDLSGEGKISSQNRSRLRLAAGLALLKLVQNVNYVDIITLEQYQQLGLVIQDSCFEVREIFTKKLHKALDSLKLSLDYMAFLVLVAADPSKERRTKVKQMVSKNAQTRRDYIKQHSAAAARPYAILPEYSLPYVVHLLAHHPDFDHADFDSLQQTKDYLWYFLEPIMGSKAENYSFLKKLLENIKQTKDKQDPDNTVANEKMYAVCDLAIACIMNKNQTFTLKDFPGSLVLPKKHYTAQKGLNNTKTYLPEGFILSPKNKKVPLDVKVVSTNIKQRKETSEPTHKHRNQNQSTSSLNKRSSINLDDKNENLSPWKKSRPSSSTKKSASKKITNSSSRAEVKKVTRNLAKSKALASPVKKNHSSPSKAKTKETKSPKKSVSPRESVSPKKSVSPKESVNHKKSVSPRKSPMKKSNQTKKQTKLDSFVNRKKRNKNTSPRKVAAAADSSSDIEDIEMLDEAPPKFSSRSSPRKSSKQSNQTNTKLQKGKPADLKKVNGNVGDIPSDEVPLTQLANGHPLKESPRKKSFTSADEKPRKLAIRRKQRNKR